MWRDHPLSQRNRPTERTVGVGVGGDREVKEGGWTKLEKWKVDNMGGLHKIGGFAPLCQLCKENFKIPHPPYYKTNPPFLATPYF